jgi:hypothetical protein
MIAGNETSSENEDKNLQNHDFEKNKSEKKTRCIKKQSNHFSRTLIDKSSRIQKSFSDKINKILTLQGKTFFQITRLESS